MIKKYDKATSDAYQTFNNVSDFYKKLGNTLVDMAQIHKNMQIVDLACGTGVVTKLVQDELDNTGHIYAVDLSKEMLEKAKMRISSQNVTFINSSSETLRPKIDVHIDAVLCNAAIWQMDIQQTFNNIRDVLKSNGTFVFNISQGKFNFTKGNLALLKNIKDYYKQGDFMNIMKEKATLRFGLKFRSNNDKNVPFLDMGKINEIINKSGFELDTYRIEELERTPEDMYEFMKIPEWTNNEFSSLRPDQRQEILDLAFNDLNKNKLFLSRWIYFRIKKI